MLQRTSDIIKKSGKPMPKVFTGSPYAYRDLLSTTKDLDGVIIATPWEWHAPMVLDSLNAGLKYVATEVILGITLQDHWDVVNAAEQHKANVMMLENVCYRRDVMAALNMVRQGLFGELLHLQGGYQHDLRSVKFNDGKPPYDHGVEFGEKAFSEARWRTNHSVHRNGDLYPTHGVGPLAMMADINRGNRFLSLSSFATKTRGLHNYIVKNGGETTRMPPSASASAISSPPRSTARTARRLPPARHQQPASVFARLPRPGHGWAMDGRRQKRLYRGPE